MQEQHVYPLSEVTGRIISAALEAHRQLGPGFEEVIYQRALALELPAHSLEAPRPHRFPVDCLSIPVGSTVSTGVARSTL